MQVTLPHSRLKIKRGLYDGDGDLLAYLVHLKHTVFCNLPDCFSRDQLESPQRILDDAVENIISLSTAESESLCLLRMTWIVLCLVKYLSARHLKCVTFQYENN